MSNFDSLQRALEKSMSLAAHLAELSEKHKLLERRIQEAVSRPSANDQEIKKLKLEKLKIKEQISKLNSRGMTRH